MKKELLNDSVGANGNLSVTKRALVALDALQRRLEAVETTAREPIAVTGMGCRFPGGAIGTSAFWELLSEGRDAITEVPPERWDWTAYYNADPQQPGKMNARWGGFLPQVEKFDAEFFGIAPREAIYMDPQQRLVLEVAWEALEDAGLPLEKLKGSRTGVFLGIYNSDYLCLQHQHPSVIDLHTGTGTVHALAANRLSYLFDLRGPSLAIDTSCSSSLVAVHQAVQSLRLRESDIALAGGVNLMLSPSSSIATAKLVNMAADGRCKTFDKRADGIVRGEGCGVVVLKRLSDAIKAGDAIWAVIRGTAVNQDGRSNGLTAPNGLAQEAVIKQALANTGGVTAEQIGYVEAHGTGTPLGDPLEIEAISAVLGQSTLTSMPCYVGSVKTNIGHLEAAAGIAGFIKTVLSLYHKIIPPHLHFVQPNPRFELAGTRLSVSADLRQWKPGECSRFAGVSAFSIGGTNSHVILEEAPAVSAEVTAWKSFDVETNGIEREDQRPYLILLSARTPPALHSLAAEYATHLAQQANQIIGEQTENFVPSIALRDLSYTSATRRTHHQYRKAFVSDSFEGLSAQLTEYASQENEPLPQPVDHKETGVVLVFPGQGSQWAGMGASLLRHEPLFRQKVVECAAVVKEYLDFDLLAELERSEGSRLHETEIAQPAIWAVEIGLAALLQAAGLPIGGVIGHSVGEVAAAQIAGMLTLEEAGKVVCARARLLRQIEGQGGMLALAATSQTAEELAKRFNLDIAAYNSERNIVLSGDVQALDAAEQEVWAKGEWCRRLEVRGAFHSRHVRVLQNELRQALDGLPQQTSQIPFYSTVKAGAILLDQSLDADYWVDNLCEAVRFQIAVSTAFQQGHRFFVEAGPQRVLQTDIRLTLKALGDDYQAISLQQQRSNNQKTFWSGLGQLYESGFDLTWHSIVPKGQVTRLPRYPWQGKSYWVKVPSASGTEQNYPLSATVNGADKTQQLAGENSDSLLERRLPTALPLFQGRLSLQTHPALAQHRFNGQPVLSVGHYLSTMLGALGNVWPKHSFLLEDLVIHKMLHLPETAEKQIQVAVLPTGENADLRFFVGQDESESGIGWNLHASAKGKLLLEASPTTRTLRLNSLLKRLTKKDFLPAQNSSEIQDINGSIKEVWVGHEEVLGNLTLSNIHSFKCGTESPVSPELVLATLQFAPKLISPSKFQEGAALIPAGIRRAGFRGTQSQSAWFYLTRSTEPEQSTEFLLNIDYFDVC